MSKHVEVMELVARLKAAEQTFVLATVVRTVSVTAAKAGAKAIIRPDGTIVAAIYNSGAAKANFTVTLHGKTVQFAMPAAGWATIRL